jgi:hypothetical protein
MIGVQKELELEWQLSGLSIAFENEQELRSRGFAKTPDFHLLVPIGTRFSLFTLSSAFVNLQVIAAAIQGRLVCWIDSKAMFGDPASHRTLVDEQLRIYVNRFASVSIHLFRLWVRFQMNFRTDSGPAWLFIGLDLLTS